VRLAPNTRLKLSALGLAPALLAAQAPQTTCTAFCLAGRARVALAAGQHADFLKYARQIATRVPDHPGVIYAVASGFGLLGQTDSALSWLDRLAQLGASRAPATDSAFAALWNGPRFRAIQARLDLNRTPIVQGTAAFSLPDPDLIPEALAWDPIGRTWLVGSMSKRKLIRLRLDGTATDFLSAPDLLRVGGVHVDSARRLLWFTTWAPRPGATGLDDALPSQTRLFKCDLSTGRILRRYAPADSATGHLFNDLAIATNGDVFVTDIERGLIYRIQSDVDSLEVFLRPNPDSLSGPNGITLAADERTLFIAFVEGIAATDLASRRIVRLPSPSTTSTAQIDGLYWHRGALVAVQNQRGLEQIIRYELTPDGRSIVRAIILERGDSLLRGPTTGEIVGTRFYYIANSQFERLGYDNRLSPAAGSPPPLTTVRVIDLQAPSY
jgi:hypothetical protein